MVNSGDHDMMVPFLATQAWIRSLNYSITDDWKPWMINDQIAGYIYVFLFLLFIHFLVVSHTYQTHIKIILAFVS